MSMDKGAYTKDQLLQSETFASRKDVLSCLLEDGKTYTVAQAKALIDEFEKKDFGEGEK